ncbi:DUF7501 family protein [Natronocalculus amylovorans]|uniref:Uncharacterized protein n=1 Tax=Natronocalculus amylovorans TaxID=2917812 RepID=A0AAE3G010_9EURY|nr:hypothetical protein [Natronocalculus amylovorans]MCL9818469.1 hypothetical protein [Natronocalculus amylovorans]NUE03061.1 hypothetical protein [Halorubraceae archaeon YAN]
MATSDIKNIPIAEWTDHNHCPFCQSRLADPGAGFMDHLDENPRCKSGFRQWRRNVAGDIGSEWLA